ncbi:DEAD/DEAH box helicase [Hippea sp. KM1]|uniref:DEAD/DEAH box helicase n=1 Tax=Hippea sp. KM1 TaxID=944481 RepID=UPI00046D8911|nr:DEAD/DEAH box helicase [Hippea sp. KM1]
MNLSALAYRISKDRSHTLIVLKDNVEIEQFAAELEFFSRFFSSTIEVCKFFSYEIPPHSSIKPSLYAVSNRLASVYRLINARSRVVFITNINALIQPMISLDRFIDGVFEIKKGGVIDRDEMIKRLLHNHYTQTDMVYEIGEFSKRGAIVDVFCGYYDKPFRIEFFDDEIESIKLFYPENQRTYKEIEEAVVLPALEYKSEDDEFGYVLLRDNQFLMDYDFSGFASLACLDKEHIDSVYKLIGFYKDDGLFAPRERVLGFLDKFDSIGEDFSLSRLINESMPIDDKIELLKKRSSDNRIIIACGSKVRMGRVEEFLSFRGIPFKVLKDGNTGLLPGVYLHDGYLDRGVWDKKEGVAFVAFAELFGLSEASGRVRGFRKPRAVEFSPNDKVVHKKYGIALFKGLKKMEIEGKKEDFFELEFDEGDRVYVPVYNSDMLLAYHGSEGLSSLRNNRWQKNQESIKRSIKKILTELVNTYAKRQLIKRKPYDVDLLEVREFEAMFEYDETQDQLKAIDDIKRDMSRDVPMDRLICGDVSFGKTEVAARAIAICVFNFRQAVFMVPTTVLALQHFKNLKDRFRSFPVEIQILSRFSTKSERERILKGLKQGSIDILITTHAVYSKDVEFADLGLVVIDEEHRFGVKVKEHLKSKYPHADMLYLSATPIPRTLNMSLNGILDISVIKTPPLERKPIETIIAKRKSSIIRDAILRELSREGRVYFVHNSIETMDRVKSELDNLLPFAKKGIVHAKMPKKQIKSVFEQFNSGEFDILISTSIIESGLDIKSVDTIIIDDADRFGLSDLHQLRGRVGRGDRTAYAYLLYRGKLTENATKRLEYMTEFIERGSGLNLALKDMEIRGYGNILGKDQSGKIKSVGFSTYLSLIEEAIRELKNQPTKRDVEIKHTFDVYIPDEYASSQKKVEIYKRLANIKSQDELEELKNELVDRFGRFVEPVENLFLLASLKIASQEVYVKKLSISDKGVIVEFYIDADIDTDKLISLENCRFLSETSVFFPLLGKRLKTIHKNLIDIFNSIKK